MTHERNQNLQSDEQERIVETFEISDDNKMDFFYLIKGQCKLEFEVQRYYNPNDNENNQIEMTEEEIESKKDIQSIQKLGKRLSTLLIKPYFQTEVPLVESKLLFKEVE